jgi:predicted negative regulator of RcsB-dependent stress response
MTARTRQPRALGAAVALAVAAAVALAAAEPQRGRPPAGRGRAVQSPPADRPPLVRGEEALARAYDAILDARFDQVEAELRRACGPAPQEACDLLAATALWWRMLLDPFSRTLDNDFSAAVERAITSTERWTERAPDDAEAWFYLGGAYAARVQWRVLRGETLAAARDGKRIKQALERSIEIAPGLEDAYFGIGLYKYYADIAPTAAKVLRFFLMLPGGDKKEGLAQMLRARNGGRLLQGEADYQLHLVYLWYEHQPARALELLRGLQQHYPANPLFPALKADIEDTYQHDLTASLDSWRQLLSLAREQRVNASALAEVHARLGAARQLEALQQTDHAIELLDAVIARKPLAPYSALPQAYLRIGEAYDRLGARDAAVAAYRSATTAAPADDPYKVRERAAAALRRAPNAKHAEAYRLSLAGWRRLEDNDLAAAEDALEQSIALNADEPVAHYRFGRVLAARKDDGAALAQFELAIKNGRTCPAPILAATHLEAARLHERGGRRAQAITAYRTAATLFGGAEETRNAASRALARLAK